MAGSTADGMPRTSATEGAEGGGAWKAASASDSAGVASGPAQAGSSGSPSVGAPPEPVQMLSWRDLASSVWSLLALSARIVLRRKLLFMALGVAGYYAILYAVAVYEPNAGFSVDEALIVLVEIPGCVLGIYLAMDLMARERDRDTLETLYSTASSHYLVWTVRLVAVHGVLLATLMLMSTASYFLFAEFPSVWGGLNAFLPAFLIANLTFYFSVWCRSSNTAGMLGLGFLILVMIFIEPLYESAWFLFLKPFEAPITVQDPAWGEKVLVNRLTVFGLGLLWLFLALRRMDKREKLLA